MEIAENEELTEEHRIKVKNRIASMCNRSVNNNGVGREVKVKEPMLAIYKLVLSLIIILSEVVYDL